MERMWSKGNTPPLLVEVRTYTTTLEINLAVSQKTGNSSISRPSETTTGHVLKGCSTKPQGYLLNYVHSSFIHNSQKLETAHMSLNGRMDTGNCGTSTQWNTTQLLKTKT